ncbi:hypothetical protein [Streptomyces chilikensis]|uniref:Uncharacterized protein n=1 Tax=Streptomyces chilikensis TaxID=1194079 RepID=A0ABV3EQ27_9ACTN
MRAITVFALLGALLAGPPVILHVVSAVDPQAAKPVQATENSRIAEARVVALPARVSGGSSTSGGPGSMSSAGGMGVMGMTSGMSSAGSTGVMGMTSGMSSAGSTGMTSGMSGGMSSVGGTVSTGGTDGTQVSLKAARWVVPALLGGVLALLVVFFVKEIHGLRRRRRGNQ